MDDMRLLDDPRRAPPAAVSDAGQEPGSCGRCEVGRRTALMGVGAVGLAGLLAACGGDESTDDAGSTPGDTAGTQPGGSPTGETDSTPTTDPGTGDETPAEPEETGDGAAAALTTTGEVPVGSGVILHGPAVVVTQPAQGEFAAFSTTCTHQGCAVTEIGEGLITCPCHGSQYSVADGSVQRGPAQQPLAPVPIVVEGDQILPA